MMTDYGDLLVQRVGDPAHSAAERGEDAYALLQEIFHGYPIPRILPLLRSSNLSAVEAGIWVLSELGHEATPLITEVELLLHSPSRKVRYFAVEVVLASAGRGDGKIIAEVFTLLDDPDAALRQEVLDFLSMATETQLIAGVPHLRDNNISSLAGWLIRASHNTGDVEEIAGRAVSDDRLVRMFAVAAAARAPQHFESILRSAVTMQDEDIALFASRQLRRLRH